MLIIVKKIDDVRIFLSNRKRNKKLLKFVNENPDGFVEFYKHTLLQIQKLNNEINITGKKKAKLIELKNMLFALWLLFFQKQRLQ